MPRLVSILTRTMGRPCLAEAAASVAAQTWPAIEWLVVDAAGTGLVPPEAGDAEVRVIGTGERMLRSRAANAGLRAARGDRLLVLDDDDLLLPDAIRKLSAALDAGPARVAYGDVDVETKPGERPLTYRMEYTPLQLHLRNMFPPNAALFDLSLVRRDGVAFDEALDWYEDWDFWLKASAHTPFVHVPEVTAIYRLHLSASGLWQAEASGGDPEIDRHRDAVIARHAARADAMEREFLATKESARRWQREGRLEAAAQAWGAAHAMLPSDDEPVLNYAAIAAHAGDARTAVATLRAGLARDPVSESLADALAKALEAGGDTEGARLVRLDIARRLGRAGAAGGVQTAPAADDAATRS